MNMFTERAMLFRLETDGFAVQESILSEPEIDQLIDAIEKRQDGEVKACCDTAFPVRGILFDKIPEANWKVPWHHLIGPIVVVVTRREFCLSSIGKFDCR